MTFDWSSYRGNLDWLPTRTIFMTRHGSHAYGTALSTSDLDVKGVAVPPRPYLHGFVKRFEQAAVGMSTGGGKGGARRIAEFLRKIEEKASKYQDITVRAKLIERARGGTMKQAIGYALQDANGELHANTFSEDKDQAWARSYETVNEALKWEGRYWKQWEPSLRAARRAGWKIVKVKLSKAGR
jgi:hypothetical protein